MVWYGMTMSTFVANTILWGTSLLIIGAALALIVDIARVAFGLKPSTESARAEARKRFISIVILAWSVAVTWAALTLYGE